MKKMNIAWTNKLAAFIGITATHGRFLQETGSGVEIRTEDGDVITVGLSYRGELMTVDANGMYGAY